jgi:hypothetical protein
MIDRVDRTTNALHGGGRRRALQAQDSHDQPAEGEDFEFDAQTIKT